MTGSPGTQGWSGMAIVPTGPLLLPVVSHAQPAGVADQVQAARSAIAGAWAALGDIETLVVVAAGTTGIHATARSSLRGLGVAAPDHDQPIAAELVAALVAALELPQHAGPLGLDLAVLVRLLAAPVPVAPIAVAPSRGEALIRLGVQLAAVVAQQPGRVGLVVAGDGSAGRQADSPRALIPGATEWDDDLLAAAGAGDVAAVAALGPEAASRVYARGWAPLTVGMAAAAQLGAGRLQIAAHPVKGVGHLIGSVLP